MKIFDFLRAKATVAVLKEEVRLRDERIAQLETDLARAMQNTRDAIANTNAAIEAANLAQAECVRLRAQLNGGTK